MQTIGPVSPPQSPGAACSTSTSTTAATPYTHGYDWAQLLTSRDGALVALLGYGAGKEAYPSPRGGKAPADIDIHGKPVGNMIAQHFAQAMASGLEYKVTSAPGWT